MSEPDERESQKRRAEELRSEIEELQRGGGHRPGVPSPREFTDEAAAEAARQHEDTQRGDRAD
jgi:hypothetical protein